MIRKIFFCLVFISAFGRFQSNAQGIDPGDVGKIRAEFRLCIGGGFETHPIFETTDGTTINISAGGGLGAGVNIGYRLFDAVELSSEFLYQMSVLDQPVSNATTTFRRFVITPTAKYLFFLKKDKSRLSINAGGGWGIYPSAKLDIDASNLPNGSHDIYEYNNGSGPHGCIEFEFCTRKKISFLGGIKFNHVTYKLESIKSDGITYPLNYIPQVILKEYGKIDGSGLDLYAGISFLF